MSGAGLEQRTDLGLLILVRGGVARAVEAGFHAMLWPQDVA